MSLIDKIEDLQKKPEPVKKRILFISIGVIMFIVISVWLSTLRVSLKAEEASQIADSPFRMFKDTVVEGFNDSKQSVVETFNRIKNIYGEEKR